MSGDTKDHKNVIDEGKAFLGETIKKVFSTGVSAAFMTEEGIRSYLSELKLPKEIVQLILQGAQKSKEELTQKISKEVLGILSKVDWAKEASKFAENHRFKISAEFEFVKKESKNREFKNSTDPLQKSSSVINRDDKSEPSHE